MPGVFGIPTRHPNQRRVGGYGRRGARSAGKIRLFIALAIAAFAFFSFYKSKTVNRFTDEKQFISVTPQQEIAIGLQAAPSMAAQHGGLHPDSQAQAHVDQVGQKLVAAANLMVQEKGQPPLEWQFDFHLLADPQTVNAFALPGGQAFITAALYGQLETEGQLAGVLAHEIVHVLARHGAQRMAKQQLTQGLIGAVVTGSGSADSARVAEMVGGLINMKYGREDELESDKLGISIMALAGYDPHAMIGVMKILKASRKGGTPPEFFSTHPDPGNRIQKIQAEIDRLRKNLPELDFSRLQK